ncbi:hypothetical protein ACET6H_08295 [Aeromonas veronii]
MQIPYVLDDRFIHDILERLITHGTDVQFYDRISYIDEIISYIEEKELGVIYICDNIYDIDIAGTQLCDVLYAHTYDGAIRDQLLQLAIIIDKAVRFDSADYIYSAEYIKDAPFLLSSFISNTVSGIISQNATSLISGWDNKKNILITDCEQAHIAYRIKCYSVLSDFDDIYIERNKIWFNLFFSDRANKFNSFKIAPQIYKDNVLHHLDYLNDKAQLHFNLQPFPSTFIQKASSEGIELSPESANTHSCNWKMNERNITIDRTTVLCEWHTKITKTIGRIHFNINIANEFQAINDKISDKVIIGIFTDHLSI